MYAISIRLLDIEDFQASLRYFLVPVTLDAGTLSVAGHEVSEAGWYTFRHAFGDDAGSLTVDFELRSNGERLFAQPMTDTAFSEEATSSFEAADVGTGYIWFMSSADGVDLAIDEHVVRGME